MSDRASNLMTSYIGLVRALAWKIHQQLPRSVELDDLVGYGCVGLAEAARSFDESRGIKFSTFAFQRIRGAILDGLAQMSWFRRDKFEAREYQPTSEDENAGVVIDTEQALTANQAWFRSAAERLERSFGTTGSAAEVQAVDRAASPENAAIGEETAGRLRQMIDALPRAAAELLKATYYEGLTLKDAAARLGRDKSWASRLHARTLRKLATSLKAEGYA
jgi:RNA polymerase sigma factor for flagellar operon FliA